jgi:hypothetical protein
MKSNNKQINVAAESSILHNVKEHAPPQMESQETVTEELHGGCRVSSCCASSISQWIDYDGRPVIQVNGKMQIDYPVQKQAPITLWLISLLTKRVDRIRRHSHLRPTPLPSRERQRASAHYNV